MYVDPAEVQLRGQLEQALGRSISDDEWESLKQEAASRATTENSAATGGWRSGVVTGIGWLIAAFFIGAAWWVVLFGLAWAYGGNKGSDTVTGFLFGALILGFSTVIFVNWLGKVATILLGLAFSGCLVALAVGAILQAAG